MQTFITKKQSKIVSNYNYDGHKGEGRWVKIRQSLQILFSERD